MTSEAERAHRNYADYVRWAARLDDEAALLDEDGVLALAMSTDWPDARLAMVTEADTAPKEWAARADGFLAERGRTAAGFVRIGTDDAHRAALETRGYRALEESPEMLCAAPLPARDPAPGVTVRLAADAGDIATYADVAARAFADIGLLEDPTRTMLDRPDVLLADDVVVSVAESEGDIVAGALAVLLDNGAAYVSYVSVLAEARGRALGDTVTRRVTNEAFNRGAREVTLEASVYGEGTYRRMGYRELYRYQIMVKV
jgi:ribosomal protein S18 acetylase RimI-like enzyme